MSVSSELLCSFELLKPLDSSALKSHIKKGRNKRNSTLNSPVSSDMYFFNVQTKLTLSSLRTSIHKVSNYSLCVPHYIFGCLGYATSYPRGVIRPNRLTSEAASPFR